MPDLGQVADALGRIPVRWWISGGAALDLWVGRRIRARDHVDVSVVASDLPAVVDALPRRFRAWVRLEDGLVPTSDLDDIAGSGTVFVRDDDAGCAFTLRPEDGSPDAWIYRRDPRLQVPWDRAVLDLSGIPAGAPEVQLVWKSLRPRPEDDADREAVVPTLDTAAKTFFETALLRIHPHSAWAIPIRTPFAPAKSSWARRPA
ncbi:nucleotidyltransferase domain-containing protein [Microbacterium koreense]|uniref:Nucleotidyltransferase domain-containing protein n=1 Tax=Microbacterium koreense TaxID=323761 RepID=A0ABW2ZQB8_9MICO